MKLIKRLKALKKVEGLGDQAFAEKLDISRATWSRFKNGRAALSIGLAWKIRRAYPGLEEEVRRCLLSQYCRGRPVRPVRYRIRPGSGRRK